MVLSYSLTMNAILGHKIKKVREIKGYSQDYVASKIGISQNAYSKIEKGSIKIDDDKLESIAKVLEVDKEVILNYNDNIIINNTNSTNSGVYSQYYINPIEFFERILIEKENIIKLKDEVIGLKDELIKNLSRK